MLFFNPLSPDVIGKQLKEHPGRTALVALGLGILIGRSSRR